jgi:hypothetical protein
MTVSSTAIRTQYSCNGSLTDFDFTFSATASDEIQVILTNSAGDETILTENSHYFVTAALNDDFSTGGTVSTCVTGDTSTPYAWASGYTITLLRIIPITQESNFVNGQATLYESFEAGLDKATRLIQQLQEQLNRVPKIAKTSEYYDEGYTLPDPDSNKLIGWNAGATDLATFSTSSATNINISTIYQIADYSDNLADAITDIGSDEVTLLINETADVDEDVVVPANVHLWVVRPGAFSIDSGKTLTINSPANIQAAPNQQIFTGAGTVAFTENGVVYPDWWYSGSVYWDTAIAAADTASTPVVFAHDNYSINTTLTMTAGRIWKGENWYTSKITLAGASAGVKISSFCTLRDLYFYGDQTDGQICITNVQDASYWLIDRCRIYYCNYGVSLSETWLCAIQNSAIRYNTAAGVYIRDEYASDRVNNFNIYGGSLSYNDIGFHSAANTNLNNDNLYGVDIEKNDSYGVKLEGNYSSFKLDGCHIETNVNGVYLSGAGYLLNIKGGMIYESTYDSTCGIYFLSGTHTETTIENVRFSCPDTESGKEWTAISFSTNCRYPLLMNNRYDEYVQITDNSTYGINRLVDGRGDGTDAADTGNVTRITGIYSLGRYGVKPSTNATFDYTTIASGDSTKAVSFSTNEPDTKYAVYCQADYDHGGIWITNKTVTGFTINVKNATGADEKIQYMITRQN